MSNNRPKNIVILSTEPWGKMLLSKMHYAIELVDKGYKVFFVNPPRESQGDKLASVIETQKDGNLVIIETKTIAGSLFFRHKLFFIYKLIAGRYTRAIKKIVDGPIDEVWNFNPHTYVDLRSFHAGKTMLLIYDFYKGEHVFKAAETADAVISVSQVILDHYKDVTPPKLLLQHGLGKHFEEKALERVRKKEFNQYPAGKLKAGYVGNLLRVGMNTSVGTQIIESHPDVEFHFWGPCSLEENNVNGAGTTVAPELIAFIEFLQKRENVFLHGVMGQQELAEGLAKMDTFLFLYSPRTEMNGASNSHKLLEYLSTGKVIVSTCVSNYLGTDLLLMCGKEEEEKLPELFKEVVNNFSLYSSEEQQLKRLNFALDNTYTRQIERIQQFVQPQ